MTSWGVLIPEGAAQMESAPWLLIFPATFLAITLSCFNCIGEACATPSTRRTGELTPPDR
jgi:ABC-type dipeptide/oligopeptide/nickel transport system permease subunit